MAELNPNGEINAMVCVAKNILNQQEKAKNLKDPRKNVPTPENAEAYEMAQNVLENLENTPDLPEGKTFGDVFYEDADPRKEFYKGLNKNITKENGYGNLANKLLDSIDYIDEEK